MESVDPCGINMAPPLRTVVCKNKLIVWMCHDMLTIVFSLFQGEGGNHHPPSGPPDHLLSRGGNKVNCQFSPV